MQVEITNPMEVSEIVIRQLIQEAEKQLAFSYSPYSKFRVAAALLAEDGTIYTGCNIENASYTPTNCAERTAFFKAVSEGITRFHAIVVLGGPEGDWSDYCPPCGVCRQVMMEFCDPKTFQVILPKSYEEYQVLRLEELMPLGFGPANL